MSFESQKLVDELHLDLGPALSTWFDHRIWERGNGAEFSRALSPDEIVQPDEGTIWAGFMRPDTIPLAGNEYGDWLCACVDSQGKVTEILLWSHVGGDWIPYGADWPEAVLFDAAAEVLYQRRHEFQAGEQPTGIPYAWADWAADWLEQHGRTVARFWRISPHRDLDPLSALADAGIAITAVAHDRILRALDAELRAVLTLPLAKNLKIEWEPAAVSWLFDTQLMPDSQRAALSQYTRISQEELLEQDWHSAERVALELLRQRQDLGWAFDIAGWAAERRGDRATAVARYLDGIKPSVFSDNTTRFRTHWFANGYGKFSAARLYELRDELPVECRNDPYLSLFLVADNRELRTSVRDYWLQRASQAEAGGDFPNAYHCYFQAGWDMGLQEIDDFRAIFQGLRNNATLAGWQSLAALAEFHNSFLL